MQPINELNECQGIPEGIAYLMASKCPCIHEVQHGEPPREMYIFRHTALPRARALCELCTTITEMYTEDAQVAGHEKAKLALNRYVRSLLGREVHATFQEFWDCQGGSEAIRAESFHPSPRRIPFCSSYTQEWVRNQQRAYHKMSGNTRAPPRAPPGQGSQNNSNSGNLQYSRPGPQNIWHPLMTPPIHGPSERQEELRSPMQSTHTRQSSHQANQTGTPHTHVRRDLFPSGSSSHLQEQGMEQQRRTSYNRPRSQSDMSHTWQSPRSTPTVTDGYTPSFGQNDPYHSSSHMQEQGTRQHTGSPYNRLTPQSDMSHTWQPSRSTPAAAVGHASMRQRDPYPGSPMITPTRQRTLAPPSTTSRVPKPLSVQEVQEWGLAMRRKFAGVSKSKGEWYLALQQELCAAGGTERDVPLSFVKYIIESEIIPGLLQTDLQPQSQVNSVIPDLLSSDPQGEEEETNITRRMSALHYPPLPNVWRTPPAQEVLSVSSLSDGSGLPAGWQGIESDPSEYNPSESLFDSPSDNPSPLNQHVGRQGDNANYDLEPTPYPRQMEAQPPVKRSVTFADDHPPKRARQDPQPDGAIPSLLTINTRPPPPVETQPPAQGYDTSFDSNLLGARVPKQQGPVLIAGKECSLSNMYPSTIFWKGTTFLSGEMKYQYDKKMKVGDKEDAKEILTFSDAFKCKAKGKLSGKKVKEKRDKWGRFRVKEQVHIFQLRDAQDPVFATDLKATGDRILVHDIADPYWGNHRYRHAKVGEKWVKERVNDGLDIYAKVLMAFRDERYGTSPKFNRADTTAASQHRSLCNMVRGCMLKKSEIPKLPDNKGPTGPPPAIPLQYKLIYGDSLVNDKAERTQRCRVLQLQCRKACKDENIFVAAEPGKTLGEMKNKVGDIQQTLPHVKPDQVTDLVVAGGINDILNALKEWREYEEKNVDKSIKRDVRERKADEIVKNLADTVKAARTFYPKATIHVTKILNHPILKEQRYGFQMRESVNKKITEVLHSHPEISHHFTPEAWEQSHDKLHLSLTAKKEYGENLAAHFEAVGVFRDQK